MKNKSSFSHLLRLIYTKSRIGLLLINYDKIIEIKLLIS